HPSLGKSTFLMYLLLHRLQHCLPTAIQFTKDVFILFDANGATLHNTAALPSPPCLIEKCWALSDSNADAVRPCGAFLNSEARIIQTTSPLHGRWKEWHKQRRGEIVFVALPTLLEIAAIAHSHGLDPAAAVAMARKWGPCTRTVLDILVTGAKQAGVQARAVANAARQICSDPMSVLSDMSPRITASAGSPILFVHPSPDGPDTMVHKIPTAHLAAFLDKAGVGLTMETTLKLHSILSIHPLTRAGAGWTFEYGAHMYMGTGKPPLAIEHGNERKEMQPVSSD
ncbi:hypothetical protein C8Q74DRAFT_1187716, partial [Fomes fomentarius]